MTRSFKERNQLTVGICGLLVTAALVVLALNVATLRGFFYSTDFTADFAEAGGLRPGDDVRIAGLTVGSVNSVDLVDQHVEVSFALEDVRVGDTTRAAIKSDNALGRKFLELEPSGTGDETSIPLERTVAPYGVTEALSDLTANNAEIDVDQLALSFSTLTETFGDTAPALDEALQGVTALSQTISSRDAELQRLFQSAEGLTSVLANRSVEITEIFAAGNQLFAELESRRLVIRDLLANTQAATVQLEGFVTDNQATIGPALEELRGVIDILNRSADDLDFIIQNLGGFVRSLGEAVGGGPFFYAYLQNLAPVDLLPVLPDLIRSSDPAAGGTPDPTAGTQDPAAGVLPVPGLIPEVPAP